MADPRSGAIEACVFKIVLIQQVTVPEIRAVGRTRLQHLRQLDRNLRCFRLCVNPSDHVCVSTGAHLFPAPLPFPSRVCQAPWAGHGWQSAWKPADIVPDERRAGWRQRDCCSASKSEDTNVDVLLYWVYGPGHYTQVLYIIVSLFRLYFFFFYPKLPLIFLTHYVKELLDLGVQITPPPLPSPPSCPNPPKPQGGTSVNTVSKFPGNKGPADRAPLSLVAAWWAGPTQSPVASSCLEQQSWKYPPINKKMV